MKAPADFAANTIPLTFNSDWKSELPPYTVVGGSQRAASTGLSLVLLNRDARSTRKSLFQELEHFGFDYITSIEGNSTSYDLEDLAVRFPFVRFILIKERITIGECLNIAAIENPGPSFFVMWNDHRIFNGINAARMAQLYKGKRLCTVPAVQNTRFETLKTVIVPSFGINRSKKETIKAVSDVSVRENQSTLYPYDWLGVYDRDLFLRLGGFDRDIIHPHWQLMDFGFRAFLWGSEIRSTRILRLVHEDNFDPMDENAGKSYRLFYLKNLAPEWRGDHAYLPLRCFPGFLAGMGWDIPGAWSEFAKERKWVLHNSRRFCRDARDLTDYWKQEDSAAYNQIQNDHNQIEHKQHGQTKTEESARNKTGEAT